MTQQLTLFQTIKYSNPQKKCFKIQNHTHLKLSPLYLGLCVGLNKRHMRYFLAMVLRSQNWCVKVVSEALYQRYVMQFSRQRYVMQFSPLFLESFTQIMVDIIVPLCERMVRVQCSIQVIFLSALCQGPTKVCKQRLKKMKFEKNHSPLHQGQGPHHYRLCVVKFQSPPWPQVHSVQVCLVGIKTGRIENRKKKIG